MNGAPINAAAVQRGREHLYALLGGLAQVLGDRVDQAPDLAAPELFFEVLMDGTTFVASHHVARPMWLHVRCFLGQIDRNESTAWPILMRNSALLGEGRGFAVDADSGELVFCFTLPLNTLSAASLLDVLHELAVWCVADEAASNPLPPGQWLTFSAAHEEKGGEAPDPDASALTRV